MKTFSPLVREHFEPKQTLCQMIITMDISTVESVTSPSRRLILRLILFNDASLFSLLLSVLISGRATGTERSPPGCCRNLTGTFRVCGEGEFCMAVVSGERCTVLSSLWPCFFFARECVLVLLSFWGLFCQTTKLGTFWNRDFLLQPNSLRLE